MQSSSFFSSPFWQDVERQLKNVPAISQIGGFEHVGWHFAAERLLHDRLDCIYRACNEADRETLRRLHVALDGLSIEPILHGLLETLKEAVLIVGGSVGVGAGIGAGVGSFFGGIGAIPGGAAGAALGAKVGGWILAALGLKSLAEYLVDGLPRIFSAYHDGFTTAWIAGRDSVGEHLSTGHDRSFSISVAAGRIADGHVALVLLLLTAITAYLARGKSMQTLAKEARGGRLGGKFSDWLLKNEDKLRSQRKLQDRWGTVSSRVADEAPASRLSPSRHNSDREPPIKPKGMPQKKVRCFEPNDLPQSKIPEFDRQLEGQERGLNEMTVEEYLKGREAFENKTVVRDVKVAREARADYAAKLAEDLADDLLEQGLSRKEAKAKAAEMAAEKMKTLAALHNPDMKAGGKDIIGDFGDRGVNSRIGSQWRSRIGELDEAAMRIPEAQRKTVKMNAKLIRCK